jgi:hypothetical protein
VPDLDDLLRSGITDAAMDAADVPEFGSVARRGRQRRRWRAALVGGALAGAAAVALVAAGRLVPDPVDAAPQYAGRDTSSASADATSPGSGAGTLPPLPDGPVTPGRYVFTLRNVCDDEIACPPGAVPPAPLPIEVTVPEGWKAANEYYLLTPTATGTGGPSGAGLVLGWTNFYVRLYSDPCRSAVDEVPDVQVGPTVDDFVDAVQADPALEVTAPTDVELGGYPGRHFVLRGPSDISGCAEWRPWEPGFYVQGIDNEWDVWAVDVDGNRVVVVAQRFPATSAKVRGQLDDMVESITFRP